MAEHLAELVVLHLADEGGLGAEGGEAGDGVGGRAAGNLHRRRHGVIERGGTLFVDQRHAALGDVMVLKELIVHAREHIDDGIADAGDGKTRLTHEASFRCGGKGGAGGV